MKNSNGYQDSFAKLLQCPTVSDSGSKNFDKFHKVLEKEFPNVHKNCEIIRPGGDSLLFKWKGENSDRPIILMAHQDVVPAVGGDWKYEPFSGTIADGKVWGRGAMDCKNTLFCTIQSVEELIAEKIIPKQDVYLSYSHNEETAGDGSSMARDWLKKNNVKPSIVIDEGGAIVEEPMPNMVKPFAMVGIVEKGYADIKFIARSAGGHSSQPPKNTPIARLSAFVNYCEKHQLFERKMTEVAQVMLENLSDGLKGGSKLLAKNAGKLKKLFVKLLPKITPFGGALFGTTMVFTMSGGAEASNVIPQEAHVIANLRYAPDDDPKVLEAKLEKIAKKFDIEMQVIESRPATPMVDIESKEYKYFINSIEKTFPDIGIAPYLIFGGTDCRTMQTICNTAIRCTPCKLNKQQLASMHASNENIDIKSIEEGVLFFKNFLKDFE